MAKCTRCGMSIRPHRWLMHEFPVKKAGIKYLCTGYGCVSSECPICDRCSDEYEKFIHGEHVDDIQRFDRCPLCGAPIEPKAGKQFCSSCGVQIETTHKQHGTFYPVTVLDQIRVVG